MPRRYRGSLLVIVGVFLQVTLLASQARQANHVEVQRFDEIVREDFFSGLRGDKGAFERAMKRTEERLKLQPSDPEALVWHGAALYYDSGRIFATGDWKKGL